MTGRLKFFAPAVFLVLQACGPGNSGTDVGAAAGDGAISPTADSMPPNILFIVADDIGFTDLGSFGSEIPTPNLDRLAYAGLRLNNFHAGAACRTTRLMIMSGAGADAANDPMPDAYRGGVLGLDYAIIPELLKDAGYATYMAGKWDLGEVEGYGPNERGFDRSFTQLFGSGDYLGGIGLRGEFGYEEDGRVLTPADLPDDFYATGHYTDKMLEYLRSTDAGTPWFGYLPYTAPHWPLQLPDDWLDRHAGNYDEGYDALRERRVAGALEAGILPEGLSLDRYEQFAEPWTDLSSDEQRRYARAQEIYAGMIEYLDMSVGRIVDYLDESGQLENTVIVYSADHGASGASYGTNTSLGPQRANADAPEDTDNRLENFGRATSFIDHGGGFGEAATAPFKLLKGSLYEGGLRAAAFVYYPAEVAAGGVSDEFMTVMDILPTFLEIAGTGHPGSGAYRDGREINDIVGRSAWPYLTGEADRVHPETDSAGWTGGGGGGALIRGGYKVINTLPQGGVGAGAETIPWRLYDLSVDPGENDDLAAAHPDLVAELVAEWEARWR